MENVNNVIIEFDENEVSEVLDALQSKYNKGNPVRILHTSQYVIVTIYAMLLISSLLIGVRVLGILCILSAAVVYVYCKIIERRVTWYNENSALGNISNLTMSKILCIPALQERFDKAHMTLIQYILKDAVTDISISSRGDVVTATIVEEDDCFSDLSVAVEYKDDVPVGTILLTPTVVYVNTSKYKNSDSIKVDIKSSLGSDKIIRQY